MKRICLILLLMIAGTVRATDYVRYVDPDVGTPGNGQTWGTAYDSQFDFEAAEEQTPSTGETMTVHLRSSAGTDDTTAVVYSGWDAGAIVEIVQDDFPAAGILDTTKYNLSVSNTTALTISEENIHLHNVQIVVTTTSTNDGGGILVTVTAAGLIVIDSCIIKGVCSGTGNVEGIHFGDSSITQNVYNTIVYGFLSGATSTHRGIYISNSLAVNIYNCTVYGNYRGIQQIAGTTTVKNSVVFNNTDDWTGTIAADYCASDDADASTYTNGQDFTAEATDWNAIFTSYSTGDVSLKNYTTPPSCVDLGTADLFDEDDDIIGTVRPQGDEWDIGAFEYVQEEPPAGINVGYYRRRM